MLPKGVEYFKSFSERAWSAPNSGILIFGFRSRWDTPARHDKTAKLKISALAGGHYMPKNATEFDKNHNFYYILLRNKASGKNKHNLN